MQFETRFPVKNGHSPHAARQDIVCNGAASTEPRLVGGSCETVVSRAGERKADSHCERVWRWSGDTGPRFDVPRRAEVTSPDTARDEAFHAQPFSQQSGISLGKATASVSNYATVNFCANSASIRRLV